ncbi:hypothetical protein RB200_10985 [Streptomyces sp. PmtG]
MGDGRARRRRPVPRGRRALPRRPRVFPRLAADLCAVSPDFARIWAEHPVGASAHGTKTLTLPDVGELTFEYTTLPLPDLPGHRLLLHTPAPGTPTERRLADLLAARP